MGKRSLFMVKGAGGTKRRGRRGKKDKYCSLWLERKWLGDWGERGREEEEGWVLGREVLLVKFRLSSFLGSTPRPLFD